MISREDSKKIDIMANTIIQLISFTVGLVALYFLLNYFGFSDWVRKNSFWFLTFMIFVFGIYSINLLNGITAIIKTSMNDDTDSLLEKIKDLESKIDIITNTVFELEDRNKI